MSFEFKLPDLGEGIHEAEVLAVKVSEGQQIAEDQVLFEVETDKAVVEIPSPVAGKALKIQIKEGQIVAVGNVMISIEEAGEKQTANEEKIAAESSGQKEHSPVKEANSALPKEEANADTPVIATPATRQLARELKIDLHKVRASGAGGKISKEDVLAYAESLKGKKLTPPPSGTADSANAFSSLPDFSKFGEVERIPMRSLRRKTAQLMSLSWTKIPHVTHCDDADITELEQFRNKYQDKLNKNAIKLTVTAFVIKAVSLALQEFPDFNTSLDEQTEEIIFKRYYNMGMAVATDRGLIVPVIRAVDKRSISELATDIGQIAEKARTGKIELSDLQGATFTVTNVGIIGGTSATPIIHHPEAAILAVMRTVQKPVVKDGKVQSALIMPLCLAFDHRLADGAEAARFVRTIVKKLEDPGSFEQFMGV